MGILEHLQSWLFPGCSTPFYPPIDFTESNPSEIVASPIIEVGSLFEYSTYATLNRWHRNSDSRFQALETWMDRLESIRNDRENRHLEARRLIFDLPHYSFNVYFGFKPETFHWYERVFFPASEMAFAHLEGVNTVFDPRINHLNQDLNFFISGTSDYNINYQEGRFHFGNAWNRLNRFLSCPVNNHSIHDYLANRFFLHSGASSGESIIQHSTRDPFYRLGWEAGEGRLSSPLQIDEMLDYGLRHYEDIGNGVPFCGTSSSGENKHQIGQRGASLDLRLGNIFSEPGWIYLASSNHPPDLLNQLLHLDYSGDSSRPDLTGFGNFFWDYLQSPWGFALGRGELHLQSRSTGLNWNANFNSEIESYRLLDTPFEILGGNIHNGNPLEILHGIRSPHRLNFPSGIHIQRDSQNPNLVTFSINQHVSLDFTLDHALPWFLSFIPLLSKRKYHLEGDVLASFKVSLERGILPGHNYIGIHSLQLTESGNRPLWENANIFVSDINPGDFLKWENPNAQSGFLFNIDSRQLRSKMFVPLPLDSNGAYDLVRGFNPMVASLRAWFGRQKEPNFNVHLNTSTPPESSEPCHRSVDLSWQSHNIQFHPLIELRSSNADLNASISIAAPGRIHADFRSNHFDGVWSGLLLSINHWSRWYLPTFPPILLGGSRLRNILFGVYSNFHGHLQHDFSSGAAEGNMFWNANGILQDSTSTGRNSTPLLEDMHSEWRIHHHRVSARERSHLNIRGLNRIAGVPANVPGYHVSDSSEVQSGSLPFDVGPLYWRWNFPWRRQP